MGKKQESFTDAAIKATKQVAVDLGLVDPPAPKKRSKKRKKKK